MLSVYQILKLKWKTIATYDLHGKIAAYSEKRVLKPINVCKCMVEEVMAYPNEEKYSTYPKVAIEMKTVSYVYFCD